MNQPTRYCLGFLFSEAPEYRSVCLIRKTKPEWQRGKLNGVGGKIKDGELPLVAMRREFMEETGCRKHNWVPFAVLAYPEALVYCFASEDQMLIDGALRTMTDEEVVVVSSNPPWRTNGRIRNLGYLIPMAQEALSVEKPEVLTLAPCEYPID